MIIMDAIHNLYDMDIINNSLCRFLGGYYYTLLESNGPCGGSY